MTSTDQKGSPARCPLYEYRCKECRRRSTVLVRSIVSTPEPSCEHCGGGNLTRIISKVSFHRSWGDSLNWVPDSGYPEGADQDDSRQMAQYMRRMQKEMGEEVTPEFEEMLDELESETEQSDYDGEDMAE